MALNCKSNGNGGGKLITDDAYLYSGEIEDVGILNGTTPEGWKQPIEIGVKLYLKQGNLSFQPELMIFGSVKRNPDGSVADWGGAFPVRDVINQIAGYDGPIGENLELPIPALKQLIGKQVFYVRYKTNRPKEDGTFYNSTYREVAPTEGAMVEKWKKQVSKGYPKDYFHNPNGTQGASAGSSAEGQVF